MSQPGSTSTDEAFVTLATNDQYALGCLVLAQSLRQVKTTRSLCIMITEGVSQVMRQHLGKLFDFVEVVDLLDSQDAERLTLLQRPDLGVTLTKIHCWTLTRFRKCVFMDADCLVVTNVDDMFQREELSAAADSGWPDCFNSGVFVFTPSLETHRALLQLAASQGSFDGGDQGLLNLFFHTWSTGDSSRRLPFTYNMTSNAFYTYLPALKYFGREIKVVHFIGATKPWHHRVHAGTREVTTSDFGSRDFLQRWWNIYYENVHPMLQPVLQEFIVHIPSVPVSAPAYLAPAAAELAVGSREHREAWEQGRVDYGGRDSFDNIQRRLDDAVRQAETSKK